MFTPTPEFTPEDLGRYFDSGTLSRARGYVARDMVVRADLDPSMHVLTGTCAGGSGRVYTVRVEFAYGAAGWEIDWTSCSCPVGELCKHAAALVLTAARPRVTSRSSDPWSDVEAWESLLADIVAEVAPVTSAGMPMGLQISSTRAPSRHAAGDWPTMRPMTIGKRGNWIRSGASWRHLEFNPRAGDFDADQYESLRAIALEFRRTHPYAQNEEMPVTSAPPTIWRLLADAASAGVALITHPTIQADTVVLADAATLELDIGHDDDGVGARISAVLEVDGRRWDDHVAQLVGSPVPHGMFAVADRVLTFAPLIPRPGATLARLYAQGRAVTVPPSAVDRFTSEMLPRLSAVVPVRISAGAFTPPRVDGPFPVLTIDVDDVCAGHAWWSVRYLVDGQRQDFDPVARVDPTRFRDAATEERMWDGVIPAMRLIVAQASTWRQQAAEHRFHSRDLDTARSVAEITADIDRIFGGGVRPTAAHDPFETLAAGVRLTPLETAQVCVEIAPELAERFPDLVIETDDRAEGFVAAQDDVQIEFSAPDADPDGAVVGSDWFDLEVTVRVDGESVALADVFGELAVGSTHMLLPSGVYFPLDTPELSRLGELISEARSLGEIDSGRARAGSYNVTLWEELLSLGVVDEQTRAWQHRMARLSAARPQRRVNPPQMLQATLRGYQQDGLDWLSFLWDNGLGGILADDMGLGKTVQTLAVIARIVESGSEGTFLVVAPTSVVTNWVNECGKFVPDLAAVAVTATSKRSGIALAQRIGDADIVVTSYALMRIDFDSYDEIDWAGVIFDEAQFVKNHNSKGHQCARRLRAPFKLAITGTPMENNLMELWSLLSITAPGLFPRPQTFTDYFGKPIESGQHPERLAVLRRRIKPMMLRRKKEQVASDLPSKQQQVLAVQLSPKHRKAYDTRLARERQKVLGLLGDWEKNRFAIFRSLTMLRQMSLHAGLVDESMRDIASAKVDFLLEQLPELIAEGHSALVFSQFTGFLAMLRLELDAAGIGYSYLDGSMSAAARAEEVAAFSAGGTAVFLISLKAGGFGLNLTEADYCFICDPWWNPAAEAQAIDRAHRIGQTRPVTVYRLVSADTIEEKVVALQNRKRELFSAVIDDGDEFGTAIAASDIRALLD